MKSLERILKNIKRGENIELYALIVSAIPLALLSWFGMFMAEHMIPICMGVFAIALLGIRYRLDSLSPPAPRVYENWGVWEISALLRQARSSITVIDSWLCEATEIARSIREAADAAKSSIEVNLFFIDPDKPYGGQRIAEMEQNPSEISEKGAKGKFRGQFESSMERLRQHLKSADNVDLHIFLYSTMPSLRLYVIDNQEFVFCWFPLGKSSSDAACFHLSARSSDKNIYLAIKEIRDEIKAIRDMSIENNEIV